MQNPHDWRLVNRVADSDHAESLAESTDGVRLQLDHATFQDIINIAHGRYSPLSGFITQNNFLKVIDDMTLEDGTVWSLPIVLDVDGDTAADPAPGTRR